MNNAENHHNIEQVESKNNAGDAAKRAAEMLSASLSSQNVSPERQEKNVQKTTELLQKYAPEALEKHAVELQAMLNQIA